MEVRMVSRVIAACGAIVGGLTGGSLGAGSWTYASVSAVSPRCASYQLLIKPVSNNGAAGHISEMFEIHDLLPGACSLFGYPSALLLNKNFYPTPTHETRSPWPQGGPGPAPVTLTPRHDAYFVLSWEHISLAATRPCPASSYVMLWAPNDRLPSVVAASIDACGGKVSASPVAGKKFWKCTGSCGLLARLATP